MASKPKLSHVSPKKNLGQHFLRRKEIAQDIVNALEANPNDTVIEVGAGTGELTRMIVEKTKKVVAVELDKSCHLTLELLADLNNNLELFFDDVRNLKLANYAQCLVLGNLPYHLSGEILFWLLAQKQYWQRAVLTVQAEFANRLVAKVGSHDYSALSVISQTFIRAKKLFDIPADAFVPPPKVKSTTVRLETLPPSTTLPVSTTDRKYDEFVRFVKGCFTHRRKTLVNNLKRMDIDNPAKILDKLGLAKNLRPQNLSPQDYAQLIAYIN